MATQTAGLKLTLGAASVLSGTSTKELSGIALSLGAINIKVGSITTASVGVVVLLPITPQYWG